MKISIKKASDIIQIFIISVLIASFSLTSCKKKEEDEVIPAPVVPIPPPPPENPLPSFSNGNGTLTSIKSRTFQNLPGGGTEAIDLGLAVSVFYGDASSGVFVEAGEVNCNFNNLTMQTNNSYVYEPDIKDKVGIDFASDNVKWTVSGSLGIPSFTASSSNVFPVIDPISSSKTIDKTKNYRLTTDRAWDCDSVIFMLGGIIHVEPPSTASSTFTVKEMNSLKTGINYVQIAGYNYLFDFHDSKGFYFVKETVVTQKVTIE